MMRFGLRGAPLGGRAGAGALRRRARAGAPGGLRGARDPAARARADGGGRAHLLLTGHVEEWPVAEGGSAAIARALASLLASLGGRIETGALGALARGSAAGARRTSSTRARRSSRRSPARCCPRATCAGWGATATAPACSRSTGRSTGRSPGRTRRSSRRRRCTSAARSTRSPPSERAVWRGEHPERPFVLRRASRASSTATRAPAGKHTGYAYCHVPAGSTVDRTEVIERAGRALRARLPRPHPRAPRDDRGGPRARTTRRTSAARSPAASPTWASSSRARWRASNPYSTPQPAPLPLLGVDAARAAACTGCAATTPRGPRCAAWIACRSRGGETIPSSRESIPSR